jgi:hypothetical protein
VIRHADIATAADRFSAGIGVLPRFALTAIYRQQERPCGIVRPVIARRFTRCFISYVL